MLLSVIWKVDGNLKKNKWPKQSLWSWLQTSVMKPTTWGRPLLSALRSKTTSCFHCYLFILGLIYNVRSDAESACSDADIIFTLKLALVPSRSLNAAGPQWFWSVDTEKFEPAELHCASTSVRQRRLRDLSVCPEVLAYQSSRKALIGRTPFCSHCLQGLRCALVFHCLALCSIDLTSSLRKGEVAHAVTQQWPFYTLWWG